MQSLATFSTALSFILLSLSVLGAIMTILSIRSHHSNKVTMIVSVFLGAITIFLFLSLYPIGIEEHTNTVTITKVGDGFFDYNSAYFEYEGDEYNIVINNGEHRMWEMLIGKEVELTYGQIHTLIERKDLWRVVDVKLIDGEG
jgi:hypothetical protein